MTALVSGFVLFAPFSAFAAPQPGEKAIKFRGQTIYVKGDPIVKYLPEGSDGDTIDAELLLVYTDSTEGANNGLRTEQEIEAQALLVGAGGGGGSNIDDADDGPGGGGGGGEVYPVEKARYNGGEFSFKVGAGGKAGDYGAAGKNGTPSHLLFEGEIIASALGGGGGGDFGPGVGGNDIASGGGGSVDDGGHGQISDGGNSDEDYYAGGGGGAGGDGDDATPSKGGDGGLGLKTTITSGWFWFDVDEADKGKYLDASGDILCGGGGGGGQSYNTASSRAGVGVAGGGNGGRKNNSGVSGTAKTGGGGGGGGSYTGWKGGAGGSGVVIIRLVWIKQELTYYPIDIEAGGNKGTIFVANAAETNWLANGDLVIKYALGEGGLCFYDPKGRPEYAANPPIWAKARILAVGGGGGGGYLTERIDGGGGGGGAGGYVEEDGLIFDNSAEFSIEVGKGGDAGAENKKPGEPGKDSALTTNGIPVIARAIGGGGGGALSNGGSGGSGGGGSLIGVGAPGIGGDGTDGQGHRGGDESDTIPYAGAGGGGAGSDGGNPSSSGGGDGGTGKECDISGEKLWYAGGGGGAYLNRNSSTAIKNPGGSGGSGVGGVGAGVVDGELVAAGNGMDGRGGGGGGGTSQEGGTSPAGNGGSGVVIIRLSGFVVRGVPDPETTNFIYNGEERRGVQEFYAYELSGAPLGTNSGVYKVTAKIKDIYPGMVWKETGGRGTRTVYWSIGQLRVDLPTVNATPPRDNYFTFGNNAKTDEEEKLAINATQWILQKDRPGYPGETCATRNDIGRILPYCTLTGHRETNAGEYHFTAELVTTDPAGNFATNFIWRSPSTMRSQDVQWEIEQAENQITSLALADWQEGTTNKVPTSAWRWQGIRGKHPDSYPREDVVKYQWRPEGGLWNDDAKPLEDLVLPTEAGVYELRAFICADSNHTEAHQYGNWGSAERMTRFCVWRHPSKTFADWMEMTFNYSSSRFITVNLKDPARDASGRIIGGYPGFSYADVIGDADQAEIRFIAVSNIDASAVHPCDVTNVLARDELLPFKAQSWNRSGTSEIRVKMPPRSASRIRMYWRRRPGVSNVFADKLASEVTASSGQMVGYNLVNQLQAITNGVDVRAWVNWWSAEPSVTRYVELDKLKTTDINKGGVKSGTVNVTYLKMPWREVVDFESVRTNLGPYMVHFTLKELEEGTDVYPGPHVYFDGDRMKDLEIYKDRPQPIDPAGESDTVNRRVLLANDDFDGREAGNAVTNQSYFAWEHRNLAEPPTVMTNATKTLFEVMTNNLLKGTEHVLKNSVGAQMWRIESTYLGNMMTADPAGKLLLTGQYSLPWSKTARNSSPDPAKYDEPLDRRWVGQMVMQNLSGEPNDLADETIGAVIRSPWYTNGVGTVYFDAVNAFKTNSAAFRLQVEVSTNAFDNLSPMMRSNVVWKCIKEPKVYKYNGTTFTPMTKITDGRIELNVADGNGTNRFFRIIAPMLPEYACAPCRVRIRRVSVLGDPENAVEDDWHGFIVVDNVIASWPTEAVGLGSYGWYDARKTNKQILGWETAFSVDYPSARESSLFARAKYAGSPDLVTSARCRYRWRYLDAAFEPARTHVTDEDNFAVVYLDVAGGFKAVEPFDLSALKNGTAGDLEYWFDLTAIVPFYKYCDYAGLAPNIDPTGGYTENPEKGVKSRRSASDGLLPSRGTDWFVRLREGASGYESFRAYFTYTMKDEYERVTSGSQEVDLFLAEDHLWRGYLKTTKEMAGRPAKYRVESLAPETPGTGLSSLKRTYLVASEDLSRPKDIPGSPVLREATSPDETKEVYVDAATGCLMLQLDDRSMSLTISHADYQDFNGWSDAVSSDDPPFFTGSSIEGPRKKGSSSKTVRLTEAFDRWTDTPETKDWWQEPFSGTIDAGRYTGWEPFASSPTPNGWTANNGQWVARFYHPTDAASRGQSGLAVELFGAQNGNLQALNPDGNPRGLGKVTYTARIAQPIDFYDFCYATPIAPVMMTNYTFITRATFDLNKNMNFAGNASLSLVALYQSKFGCYEARWEQLKGTWNDTSKTFKDGPVRDSQRLCLYRWMKGPSGAIEPLLLGAITNNVNVNYYWNNSKGVRTAYGVNMTGNNRTFIPQTSGKSGNYLPFFISAHTDKNGVTEIIAGVHCKGTASDSGMAASKDESGFTAKNWNVVYYRDSKQGHPTAGSYGVLSANCEGVFLRPSTYSAHAEPNNTTWKNNFSYALDEFACCANLAMKFPGIYEEGLDDLKWGVWALDGERLDDFWDSETIYGIYAPTPSATLQLLTTPKGKDEWTAVGSGKTVTGFGTNLKAGDGDEFLVREVNDRSIRLSVSGSTLCDIVLTDVEFTQWRGDSYGEGDTTGFAVGEARYGYPSNIVFTTGIVVTNKTDGFAHKVKLSARRTPANAPASVRSPFFDGGTNNDGTRRGEGLGMFAFSYENAQTNADVLVQIATNGLSRGSDVSAVTKSIDTNVWTTVARFDFSQCDAEDRRKGVRTVYLGLHGVPGLMRVVVNPELVASVQSNRVSDVNAFGEIEITKVVCRDEPNLEPADWWGWNIRTVASVTNSVGDARRTYLPDGDPDAESSGLPIALNCGVTENVREEDVEDIRNHMPFVQTPTFTNNIVGEISFRARRYDNGDATQYAEVQLYGASSGKEGDDAEWRPLRQFVISNTTYEAFSYRDTGMYSAFRLAVTGVKGVVYPGTPRAYDPAVRVLIDEVSVFEAVNPEMGFEYVYPFRDGMEETAACTNVVDEKGTALSDAQPLCGENWTVQAKIQKTKLPDEIDVTDHPPRVVFHWFVGEEPWGYVKWKDLSKSAGHHAAELELADGETMVFRGSIPKARAAVVEATKDAPTVVQYSADVIYYTVGGTQPLTNSLVRGASTTWVRPSWYYPVDYNAGKPAVSAYTIIDRIAPHRVWINEVNVWDGQDRVLSLLALTNQYVEIAVPQLQSIDGWRLDYIANDGTTNALCRFSDTIRGVAGYVPGVKDLSKVPAEKLNEYRTNDYTFIAVQSPKTKAAKTWDGVPAAIDGTWVDFDTYGGTLNEMEPIALRLVRPSNVVEQEIVIEGTNLYLTGRYSGMYSATNWIAQMERSMPGGKSQFCYVGNEYANRVDQSLGVVRNAGAVSNDWTNLMVKTPGRVNEGQIVPFGYVLYPSGELMLIRAQIGPGGHILQRIGDGEVTPDEVVMMIRKGGEGTNITYSVANWWETAFVTTNGQLMAETIGKRGTYTVNVGAGASNDITVVAQAQPMSELRDKYGLTAANPYTPAVMDWLEGGKNYWGEEFQNPGEIHLAAFKTAIRYEFVTNLDLTTMYWLDIDPTVSNWVLRAGVTGYEVLSRPPLTHHRLKMHMEITNEQSHVAYAPYVLRGLEPGLTSASYAGNWTSETYKVTADLQNGVETRQRWVPVQWFVFTPDGSKANRSGSFDENYEALIDIWDPKDPSRAIYTRGWDAYPDASIWFRWAIDDRGVPVGVGPLKPDSTYIE